MIYYPLISYVAFPWLDLIIHRKNKIGKQLFETIYHTDSEFNFQIWRSIIAIHVIQHWAVYQLSSCCKRCQCWNSYFRFLGNPPVRQLSFFTEFEHCIVAVGRLHLLNERLLASCGGTSKETVLRSTHLYVSMQGITVKIPGPLEPPLRSRPKRKITALSYSVTTWKQQANTVKDRTNHIEHDKWKFACN